MSNSKSLIRTQNFLKKQIFENSVVTKLAWIMEHYFDGISGRIYKPSRKFFIKSLYPRISVSVKKNFAKIVNIIF
jgi:hypothetical protein